MRNCALVDGNERLGWLATVVFFGLNDIRLDAPDDSAFELVMAAARGAVDAVAIADALKSWR